MSIEYKSIRIAVNTHAYELWAAKKFGELDEWLRQLDAKNKKLEAL